MLKMAAEWLRVGLERPHFLPLASGQKTTEVAPAQPIEPAIRWRGAPRQRRFRLHARQFSQGPQTLWRAMRRRLVRSLPSSHELHGGGFCSPSASLRVCQTRRLTICTTAKGRGLLSILKTPPKQPKTVTVQARVEESVKTQLELYAEFIDASPSYVITEVLKLLFRKDDDFASTKSTTIQST